MDKIIIKGARENNLKNIDIEIPKNKLVVMTGVSGSGKSSLAFDTIYAEGQRRYVESLSAYARQFLGGSEKPEVDSIEGLSPSISIDQKTTNKNPRSTVGTVTEIYDYLRLLFARIGVPYCPIHKNPIKSQSIEEMVNKIMDYPEGTKLEIMSPIARGEKGTFKDLFEDLRKNKYDFTEPVEGHRNADLTRDNIEDIKHKVILDKNSILYNLYKEEVLNMPSIHRYRIPQVEEPLKVVGRAEDGTIEVIEYNDRIFGVQFHPENESINNCIFKYIISKC